MYKSTQTCCANHQVIIDSTPQLKAAVVLLGTKLAAIEVQHAKLATIIAGFAAEKEHLRDEMISQAEAIAGMLYALGVTTDDTSLQVQSRFSFSDFVLMTSEDVADTCRMIYSLAADRIAELPGYGLRAEGLDAFSDAIDDYRLLIDKPKAAIATQVGVRKQLDALHAETDALLRGRMDKLIIQFREAQPEFVDIYKSSRMIFDPPTVHTRLKGIVTTPDGQRLAGVSLLFESDDLSVTVVTGDDGTYDKVMKNGIYSVHAVKTGLQPFDRSNLKIKRGKVNHLDFVLKP